MTNNYHLPEHVCSPGADPPPPPIDYWFQSLHQLAAILRRHLISLTLVPVTQSTPLSRCNRQMHRRLHLYLSSLVAMTQFVAGLH